MSVCLTVTCVCWSAADDISAIWVNDIPVTANIEQPQISNNMSSIPHTMHLTKALKQKKIKDNPGYFQDFQDCVVTEQPTRYNSKMMNSIWGRYNEDSVHNFKSLQCAGVAATQIQGSSKEVGQNHQAANSEHSSVFRQRLRELGQEVAANYADNLHQY